MNPSPVLVITRGYPGSGKTHAARRWTNREHDQAAKWLHANLAVRPSEHFERQLAALPPLPDGPRVRVNRDDLRKSLFDREGVLEYKDEQIVSVAQRAQVRALLEAGVSVIVDDTNLKLRYARDLADLAAEHGADFHVWDFPTSRETCIERDDDRARAGGRKVGALAIADIAARFPMPWPKVEARPVKEEVKALPYVADPDLPPAWVIDIDGTLALKRMGDGERGWFDWHRVGEDLPNPAVVHVVERIGRQHQDGTFPRLILLSGRDAVCDPETRAWLDEHLDGWDELYMRPEGDQRDDTIVKAELFDTHVRNRFNVLGVLDDRPKVCRMWRAMGLSVFQVGDPHVEF